ncbi:MAG TPA: SAM-dependent methyltransferase [Anaeromyxobacteraceae bacterium]|nr:SAM-dependent methyltransferase [Anaeromyxobacteraceae bacterium]
MAGKDDGERRGPPPFPDTQPPAVALRSPDAAPYREVVVGDGVAWLDGRHLAADHAVVTSLPDVSELEELGLEGWRRWFVKAVTLACRALADEAVAVFFQTDVKRDGAWIDKAHLVLCGAEDAGSRLLWHRIACRVPPGVTTYGRPSYSHLLCVSRELRIGPGQSAPDVLPRLGEMTWARAMGREACAAVARFLVDHTGCRTVVDPFCGMGSMLAVANEFGLAAVGVERSARRAHRARTLSFGDARPAPRPGSGARGRSA